MNQTDIKEMIDRIEEKERDIVVCKQAMVNFSAMLRNDKYSPALLQDASPEVSDLLNMVYNDIRKVLPRVREAHWKDEQIERLATEVKRLKSRTLMERIRNKY